MKAIVFDVRSNSLYSIRIPFTWQSALAYPVLPPSAVIGLLANALQRHKNNKHPLEYLDLIEGNLLWAGSRLLTPCVVKSYITSAIVKWGDKPGGKFTNALGRQFAYSRKLQIAAIFKNHTMVDAVAEALKSVPLTCGDSESPVSLDGEVMIKDVADANDKTVVTGYPVPFTKETEIVDGNGQNYLMHERCKRTGNNFPLVSYMIPVREEQKILIPSSLTLRISNERVLKIGGIGYVVVKSQMEKEHEGVKRAKKQQTRRKKQKK